MALREILVAFGITVDQKPIADAEKKVGDLIGTLKKAAQAAGLVTVALGAKRLFGFIEDTVEAANMVDVFAKRLDISTQQVQEFQAIAGVTGLQMNFFQHAFRTLNFQVSQSRPEFAELSRAAGGVKFNFKDTGELFWQVGEALSSVTDKTRRAYLAQTLLGRSAQQLLPIFSGSKAEIEAFRKKIQEVSEVFSSKFIAKAKATWFETNVMGLMWKKVAGLLTEELLPAFNAVISVLESLAKWTQGWIKDGSAMNAMIAALIVGSLALASAFGGFVLEVIAAAAPFALLFLLVDDFVTFLRGGDSVIGDWLDAIFGPDGADKARDLISQLWDAFKDFAAWLVDPNTWRGFSEALNAAIRAALGETLSLKFGIKDTKAERLDREAANPNQDTVPLPPGMSLDGSGAAAADPLEFSYTLGRKVPRSQNPDHRNTGEFVTGAVDNAYTATDNAATSLHDRLLPSVADSRSGEIDPSLLDWIKSLRAASLSPAAVSLAGQAGAGNPITIENTITVQGSATASTAREIADRTGTATVSALGRDRSAIGAGVGLSR